MQVGQHREKLLHESDLGRVQELILPHDAALALLVLQK